MLEINELATINEKFILLGSIVGFDNLIKIEDIDIEDLENQINSLNYLKSAGVGDDIINFLCANSACLESINLSKNYIASIRNYCSCVQSRIKDFNLLTFGNVVDISKKLMQSVDSCLDNIPLSMDAINTSVSLILKWPGYIVKLKQIKSEINEYAGNCDLFIGCGGIHLVICDTINWVKLCRAKEISNDLLFYLVECKESNSYFKTYSACLFTCFEMIQAYTYLQRLGFVLNEDKYNNEVFLSDIFHELNEKKIAIQNSLRTVTDASKYDIIDLKYVIRDFSDLGNLFDLKNQLRSRYNLYGLDPLSVSKEHLIINCEIAHNFTFFPTEIQEWTEGLEFRNVFDRLVKIENSINDLSSLIESLNSNLLFFGPIQGEGPFGVFDLLKSNPEAILKKIVDFEYNVDKSTFYCYQLKDENEAENLGINCLVNLAKEVQDINLDILFKCIKAISEHELAVKSLESVPSLLDFEANDHEMLRNRFKEDDRNKLLVNRQSIIKRLSSIGIEYGNKGKYVADHTELALLIHEIGKKKRHLPVRQLVQRAGRAMLDFCPCWMMTPLSVAQFLTPGAIDFDLVVIDEASQLKPEDAWGIIARGKQLIVVGDQKQMPPSDFFASSSDDAELEGDEEEISGGDSESILDASVLSLLSWSLTWHYRSQHQSLIAPANNFSYNNSLILFPSSLRHKKDLGIVFNYVNGTIAKNKVINVLEANEVVSRIREIVIAEAKKSADNRYSLGVVTMNVNQQDCINNLIQCAREEDSQFDKALSLMQSDSLPEPFFVRNLENIQGDERDIIIISCTYAPHVDKGVLMQRFGPLNREGGQRRFNVLITRSKRRMEVFSSIKSDQIQFEGKHLGVRDFHLFLKYAESGADYRVLPEMDLTIKRDYDSPFEKQVDAILKHEGFITERQVGVAGYFIDLAVVHPKRQGLFALGIECDGATYHSSKSARDRDRLREQVLCERGWLLYRIWSTDWFCRPKQAKEDLLAAVRSACSL